ncbi:MAG: hypothetical protein C0490_19330 [Marivirga sp.]|nr:hypothetical protein [Marivirga sp.]
MIGLYTPVLILQAYCLYHAYQNNNIQRWVWLIVFLPAIGCAIYLYHNFYNRNNIETLAEGVKHVVNSNYKLEQLEKAHRLSDNVTTKANLAAGYAMYGRYDDAITLYQECLSGFMADDPPLRMKLLQVYFLKQDYEATITLGYSLQSEKLFQSAEERIAFAWALHLGGKTSEAETQFSAMDRPSSNHKHRLEYCKFLQAINKNDILRQKLVSLMEEFELMKGSERKFNYDIYREARELNSKIKTS